MSARAAAQRRGSAPVAAMRLSPQPGEVIDRSRELSFSWNGVEYPAYHGDTIISALAAAGERVFSRSLKYHRPRGLLTAGFHDPGCMVQVGDEPNVRGAHRLVSGGMTVGSQNTWPSLRFDAKGVNRLAGRYLTAGFYYKTFMQPRALWPAYEGVLRRFVNAGSVSPDTAPGRPEQRYAHPDVLVAGGGPAGMAAAVAAARAGAHVMLVEEDHQLGGHLRWGGEAGLAALGELAAQVAAEPGIEVLTDAVVLGRYDGNWIAVLERGPGRPAAGAAAPGDSAGPVAAGPVAAGPVAASPVVASTERLVKARAKTLVVAPGLIERPYVFAGNDLPGVMLSTAVRRLINLYAVKPGERAVVLTANADGDAAVADLKRAGVDIVRVEDARLGGDVVAASGRGGVRAVEVADGTRILCDLLVTAVGWTAPTALLNASGDRPVYSARAARFFPDLARLSDDVLVTGGIAGDGGLAELTQHATAIGTEAARRTARIARARSLACPASAAAAASAAGTVGAVAAASSAEPGPVAIPGLPVDAHPELFAGRTHGMVDFSEDVSSKDLLGAVAEGYDSVELAKRFTTATMGPLQGKLETINAVAIVASATGQSIAETGTTTWRPPYAPVTLGALAGPAHQPVRYSPMQPWHEAHGAAPLVAGAWIRPDRYGDPAAEARNVRERVGIIDVTPIGKLDLRGADVPRLLNLLYVNKWSKLEIGRVRYGVMCAEDGVVLDDGVTGRLGAEHYLMSTTSSGAATIWEWAENWLQTEHPDWQVHVTPVTTAYASINVAGPRSRDLIERVTEGVDSTNEAFPYMHVRTGRIAGVDDCVLWRIGFTGELSYELHVPAGYGLHVWETLLERGADLGAAPFGVEAQRILRLEKGHLIVGQDTDGLTRAFSAGLDWAIKLDKDDFAGKPELAWQLAGGVGQRLVGLQPADGSVVPEEASQIIDDGRIAGRITSSRMSPALGRSVCLALVDGRFAEPGTVLTVRLPSGRRIEAMVTPQLAHVDPDGGRMRV
ncbi:MAG TPA: 2Fe-2S iron-sulfur cluster-binding protein [Streptosporangiaceae bacterium]|nr:2Fe-2S iron-sulfur cluster-binding protein [Streptosporangiaceae bacterium]